MKRNHLFVLSMALLTACICMFYGCKKDDNNNNNGNGNGSETSTVKDIDGNEYKTVKIGNLWWMSENLRVTQFTDGIPIPEMSESSDWTSITGPAVCFYENNKEVNESLYGGLYNWHAVYTGKLCPDGWHVPTDEEWQQLEKLLGMSEEDANSLGWRGNDEGGKLKQTGTEQWMDPNTGATNSTGFSATPGGYRNHFNGNFGQLSGGAFYWTSSFPSMNFAWYRELGFHESRIQRSYYEHAYGFSVRCVKH